MRSVPKPAISFALHYDRCAKDQSGIELRGRLLACAEPIENHIALYDNHANAKTLYQLQPLVVQQATAAELKSLYPEAMRNKGAIARDTYLALRHAAKLCPYCNILPVKTLDHFLPQKRYPELAIAPINLVPCCSDCNRTKWIYFSTAAEGQLIHPYYDDIGELTWLFADVVYTDLNPTVMFQTLEVGDDEEISARIAFQFEKLELATMYGIYGTALASKLSRRLRRLLDAGGPIAGPVAVKKYLLEEWDDKCFHDPNSWETATYKALADNAQYCAGAFGQ
jgi:5-methylcytosine-specific restriction endonuclease McrA